MSLLCLTPPLCVPQAYVQYAYCAPCRNSFLSGRRPDTGKRSRSGSSRCVFFLLPKQRLCADKVWEFIDHFRQTGAGTANGANWQSMPECALHRLS